MQSQSGLSSSYARANPGATPMDYPLSRQSTRSETSDQDGRSDRRLESVDGGLQVPVTANPHADLRCPLPILDCEESFNDVKSWEIHIFSHFRGLPCPTSATCFLCERLPTSPSFEARSAVSARRSSLRDTLEDTNLSLESRQDLLQRRLSTSSTSSPRLGSSSPMTRLNTRTSTAVTTPMLPSAERNQDAGTRPPSIRLPSAVAEWSLFCEDAQVLCAGWRNPWSCRISERRRTADGGLSLLAERADGSRLYHDLPALGVAIPHTSHTGAYPQMKNAVTFTDHRGHKLRKLIGHGESHEREPKYIFQNSADHKAFQKLVYGCELDWTWDVMTIKSDREMESVTQTLRLWTDPHSRIPVIMFYTNNRKRSAKTYIHEPSQQHLRVCISPVSLTSGVQGPPSQKS
jgi:hypothetical protein